MPMAATYLLRFDDLSPAMSWGVWDGVEAVLTEAGVSPLLAVVPDNQDPSLVRDDGDPRFWDRVRAWQARGWSIGLHGFQHRYVSADRGLVGRHARSEFAGLPAVEQARKLDAALAIFEKEGVHADAWVAPGHTFDRTTVALLLERGIDVVSDGFGVLPHRSADGALWVPQQLWWFRRRPFGVWTVCLHHNAWTADGVDRFRDALGRYRAATVDLPRIVETYGTRRASWHDQPSATAVRAGIALRELPARLRR